MSVTTEGPARNQPESQVSVESGTPANARTPRLASALRSALGWARAALDFSARRAPLLIGGVWFVTALTVTLWLWGLEPVAFPATDEAVNRLAALLIQRTGAPFQKLPFPDPEDVVHMRLWVSLGEHAIPAYPPVTFYLYGLLSCLGKAGLLLIAAIPASAAAAFAAGTAHLLLPSRRWLALLAPTLGFPALYWLFRLWMNISLLVSCLSWAFLYWAVWRRRGSTRWLALAMLSVGAGAAVRPDYAPYLLPAALLFSLAASPTRWKASVALAVIAGACAIAVNLLLNKLTTGDPLRAAYQIYVDQYEGVTSHGPLRVLAQLILPLGVPAASDAKDRFFQYVINLGPLWLLLLGQLALIPLLLRQTRLAGLLYLAGVLVVIALAVTRMDPEAFGVRLGTSEVAHSIPRYWAPVYLFAALPPLLFLGTCRRALVWIPGAAIACVLAWLSVQEVYSRQATSFLYVKRFASTQLAKFSRSAIPSNAIVYSRRLDKVLWSRWQVGILDRPQLSAISMRRALRAGFPVFLIEPRFPRRDQELSQAMRSKHLRAVKIDGRRGIFRVEAP